jgi:uncharacterized YkwD family protein
VIKKSMTMMVTAILAIGLAACNNDTRNDLNDRDRTGMNTANRDDGIFNGRDDGIDHNGPLTEDYSNRDNSEPDFDANLYDDNRNNRRDNTITDNRTNKRNTTITGNRNNTRNNNINVNRNNRINNDDNNDMISAYNTKLNSNQYPHTRAVLIKDAKYQYIRIDPRQGNWFQAGVIHMQPKNQFQRPTAQAPTGQQGTPTAPQGQPAPAAPAPAPAAPAPAPQAQPTQPAPKTEATPQKPAQQNTAPATGANSQFVQQVIDLTNQQRSKNGLPALKADTQLNGVAQKKAVDMQQNNYFSHTSPTYGSPFDMMRDMGVTYKSAGENIAQGQRTPQEVVNAWMNSEGHRKNILSGNFTHIGVGYEGSGNHWVQMFIGK